MDLLHAVLNTFTHLCSRPPSAAGPDACRFLCGFYLLRKFPRPMFEGLCPSGAFLPSPGCLFYSLFNFPFWFSAPESLRTRGHWGFCLVWHPTCRTRTGIFCREKIWVDIFKVLLQHGNSSWLLLAPVFFFLLLSSLLFVSLRV